MKNFEPFSIKREFVLTRFPLSRFNIFICSSSLVSLVSRTSLIFLSLQFLFLQYLNATNRNCHGILGYVLMHLNFPISLLIYLVGVFFHGIMFHTFFLSVFLKIYNLKDNLFRPRREVLKELNKNNSTKIYSFNKGFLALKEDKAIRKIKKQLGKAKKIDFDPLQTLINKIQKQLSRGILRKRCPGNMQQIYRRTPMSRCDFNKVAPSDPIPTRLHRAKYSRMD